MKNSVFIQVLVLALAFADENFEIIKSPVVTDVGIWGEFEYCDPGDFVFGVILETCSKSIWIWDWSGLTGIIFLCGNGNNIPKNEISSSKGINGKKRVQLTCPNYQYATGFQLRSQQEQGDSWVGGDDRGATNFRLYCSDGNALEWNDSKETLIGNWTERQDCPTNYYMCGIQTQVNDENDRSGINNVNIKCCEIELFCNIQKRSVEITSLDNRNSSGLTKLLHAAKLGINIQQQTSLRNHTIKEHQLQVGIKAVYQMVLASITATMKDVDEIGLFSGTMIQEIELEYEIPAGVKTIVYQEVIECGKITGFAGIIREDISIYLFGSYFRQSLFIFILAILITAGIFFSSFCIPKMMSRRAKIF